MKTSVKGEKETEEDYICKVAEDMHVFLPDSYLNQYTQNTNKWRIITTMC